MTFTFHGATFELRKEVLGWWFRRQVLGRQENWTLAGNCTGTRAFRAALARAIARAG